MVKKGKFNFNLLFIASDWNAADILKLVDENIFINLEICLSGLVIHINRSYPYSRVNSCLYN